MEAVIVILFIFVDRLEPRKMGAGWRRLKNFLNGFFRNCNFVREFVELFLLFEKTFITLWNLTFRNNESIAGKYK